MSECNLYNENIHPAPFLSDSHKLFPFSVTIKRKTNIYSYVQIKKVLDKRRWIMGAPNKQYVAPYILINIL